MHTLLTGLIRQRRANIESRQFQMPERICEEWRRGRQAKVGPRGKVGHPITANLVNAMEKIMTLVSNPSREGTMECVVCELQHKIKR